MDIEDKNGNPLILEEPHKMVCENLQSESRNSLIILPRRFAKTLITTIFIVWYCLKYPDRNILLVTDVITKAYSIIKSVKSMIRSNKNIIKLFGKQILSSNENDKARLTVSHRRTTKKEPNVLAYGMLQTPQSLRADIVIFEDIISHKYQTSIKNKMKTDKNFEAIIPILERDAKIAYIGTRFHYDDIPSQIRATNEMMDKWNIIEESAEDEFGNAAFPHIINDEELKKLKQSLTPSFYASQYLNRPISEEDTLFRLADYGYYDTMPDRQSFKSVIAGVDLAISTSDTADNRAIVFIGVTETNTIYLLDCYSSKEKIDTFYKSIKAYCDKWNPDSVFVETNGAFKIVYKTFVENTIKDGSYIPFLDMTNFKNKELRIENTLLPLLKNKILLLPAKKLYIGNRSLSRLIDIEMTFFNPSVSSNKDDSIDALEIACSKAKEISSSSTACLVGGELRTASIDMRI